MAIINDRIKERRLQLGLTLLQVSERLGVKEATAQRYESGDIKNIKHDTVLNLSQILRCNPAYLMGWTDLPNIETNKKPAADSGKEAPFALSEHEKAIILAYRNKPDMQTAVDTLLCVDHRSIEPHEEERLIYRAAMSSDNHEHQIEKRSISDLSRLANAERVTSEEDL